MKNSIRKIMVGLLIVGLWVAPVVGQDLRGLESLVTGDASNDGPGTLLLLLLKGIGLTPEQKLRAKEILVTHRERLETLFRELQSGNTELANALFVPGEINPEVLDQLTERVTLLRYQLLQEGLRVVLEIRRVLTPEQRVKAARLKNQLQTLGEALGEAQQGQSSEASK